MKWRPTQNPISPPPLVEYPEFYARLVANSFLGVPHYSGIGVMINERVGDRLSRNLGCYKS